LNDHFEPKTHLVLSFEEDIVDQYYFEPQWTCIQERIIFISPFMQSSDDCFWGPVHNRGDLLMLQKECIKYGCHKIAYFAIGSWVVKKSFGIANESNRQAHETPKDKKPI
jgi:hypothetical protein